MKTLQIKQSLQLLLGFVLFWPLVSLAAIEVIQLQARNAAEIKPLIEPFLSEDAVISGTGYKLIVKASGEQMATIKELIKKLDIPASQFTIQVKTNVSPQEADFLLSAKEGVHFYSSEAKTEQDYTLRVTSGKSGFIQTGNTYTIVLGGQQNNISTSTTVTTPDVISESSSSDTSTGGEFGLHNVTSGIYLTPLTSNDKSVKLEIKQVQQRKKNNVSQAFSSYAQKTTLTVPFNTWVKIGTTNHIETDNSSTIISTHSSESESQYSVLVRVNKVR